LKTHSVVADPKFADPKNADFTQAKIPAFALGFKAIDLSDVGRRGKAIANETNGGAE